MKIAIFHNYMDNIGGAEIVSLTLARELKADIYTTVIDANHITNVGFADVLPRIHSIGKIPKQAPFKQQLALWKFRRLNLPKKFPEKYDFYIISGDWAMSGAVNNKPNLWYVHAPLNEIWEFRDMVREKMVSRWKHPIFDLWVRFNRKLTVSYARHVERWVCNSANTRNRIKKFYDADATIIHPPTDTEKYKNKNANIGDYWLSVNRLVNHKRIEIQLEAFAQLPDERLIIVGSYEKGVHQFEQYRSTIEKKTPSNVTFKHWVGDAELVELYANCKGFITTARDEDFGMTAVEAMAAGKFVIAPNEGGYKESVITSETGTLIDNITSEKLAKEIKEISKKLRNPSAAKTYRIRCQEQASKFDVKKFIAEIKAIPLLPSTSKQKLIPHRNRFDDIEKTRKALEKIYDEYSHLGIFSFYIWGSITRDDYVCDKSDIDIIAIVQKNVSEKDHRKITRTARRKVSGKLKINISYFGIHEFMGYDRESKMSNIIPPEMLLTYFDTWQHVAGRIFKLDEFTIAPYNKEEIIGFHRSKALKDLLLPETSFIERTGFAVKACMIMCHYLNCKGKESRPPYVPVKLLEGATDETRHIIPLLISLRNSSEDIEALRAARPTIMDFVTSIKVSYPNPHLTIFFEEVLPKFTEKKIPYWVLGGIAIAGIAGMFIRENKDIDVCVRESDLEASCAILRILCERHRGSWKLVSFFDESVGKTKVKVYVDGIERFSVDTICETNEGVEFVLLNKKKVFFAEKLVREERVIDGMHFFSPQKSITTDVLRYILNYYSSDIPVRLLETDSKESRYWIDAATLLDTEEFENLYKHALDSAQKSYPKIDSLVGKIGIVIKQISPKTHSFLRSHLKRLFFWTSLEDTPQ